MKKLLIFMLVLGMASTANALMLSYEPPGGDANVPALTVITINVRGDTDCNDFRISVTMTGDYTSPAVGTVNALFTDGLSTAGQLKDGSVGNVRIFQINGIVALAGTPVATSQIFATFSLTTGNVGNTITLDDYAGVYPPPTDTVYNGTTIDGGALVLNIIPEPMTIALLGLGGLFLRRRRK